MKIEFGVGVAGASGSFGGVTASRNKGGAYFRRKGNPTNPRSTGQQSQRAQLANLTAAWKGLSAVEQQAWKSAAEGGQFGKTDALGKKRNLSAAQLYTSLNLTLVSAGLAMIDVPPVNLPTVPNVVLDGAATQAETGLVLKMTGNAETGLPAALRCNVYATEPLSGGILSPGAGSYRKIATLAAADFDGDEYDAATAYTAFYGAAPTTAQNVGIRLEYVFEGVGVKYPAGGTVFRYTS